MPLQIVINDITKMKVDAIVNAANRSLLGGGGVDGCIHRSAGPGLLEECRTLGGCETGDAKVTKAYRLPCKYVIHTVGPRWKDGLHGEREKLASCYLRSLALAKERGCETVAFPLISAGAYGYPKDQALRVAMDTIAQFLMENDMTVYMVLYSRSAFRIEDSLFSQISRHIDDKLLSVTQSIGTVPPGQLQPEGDDGYTTVSLAGLLSYPRKERDLRAEARGLGFPSASAVPRSLDEALGKLDESFSQMLLRLIDERGMTDAQCYKKANVDRKLFSKIRSDVHYRPSKTTAIAFAIALELSLEETKDMLRKAGFALSHSNKFDIIIEYFIQSGNYNVFEINKALFAFDQSLLGA